MPEIIETTVYRLDELSEVAKDKARAWYRVGGFDYDWHDTVYEDFRRIAEILGIRFKTRTVRLMGGGSRQQPRFPSKFLAELDLYALLTPAIQSQGPALRSASKSLRMSRELLTEPAPFPVELSSGNRNVQITVDKQDFGFVVVFEHGCVLKVNQSWSAYGKAERLISNRLTSELCDFDLSLLSRQVRNECIWPTGDKAGFFGNANKNALGYCNPLIVRVEALLSSPELACLFSDTGLDICSEIDKFLADDGVRAMVFL